MFLIFHRYFLCYFNPRSREGSDSFWNNKQLPIKNFNPRSREGSDVYRLSIVLGCRIISIHAPARGATKVNINRWLYDKISIHAPARGATSFLPFANFCRMISIHAPARGATMHLNKTIPSQCISIHAPARGATLHGSKIDPRSGDFNPRSREGSDP